jgi:hypothetical protein
VTDRIGSYPKVYAIGHSAIRDLFCDPVLVEEKVDGSQFSFARIGGVLLCRSRGQQLVLDAPDNMFQPAVAAVHAIASKLHDGWTYRGEYLRKSKHNTLAYDRIPAQHIAIFDVNTAEECYLPPEEKAVEAQRLGFEAVPVLYDGPVDSPDALRRMLETTSFLGGQPIEGVVAKNYRRFGLDGKALMGKHVSERFKEVHHESFRQGNPQQGDIKAILIGRYRSTVRWEKAVQHLRERGELTGTPKDIGALIKEAQQDIRAECAEEIAALLLKWVLPHVTRGAVAGLPEWYKQRLLDAQFERGDSDET